MRHASTMISITRRTLALAMIASGALGVGIGELAAPLQSSAAHAVTAAANPACVQFRNLTGEGFTLLGQVLIDASKYPALIPKAWQAGLGTRPASTRRSARRSSPSTTRSRPTAPSSAS